MTSSFSAQNIIVKGARSFGTFNVQSYISLHMFFSPRFQADVLVDHDTFRKFLSRAIDKKEKGFILFVEPNVYEYVKALFKGDEIFNLAEMSKVMVKDYNTANEQVGSKTA